MLLNATRRMTWGSWNCAS